MLKTTDFQIVSDPQPEIMNDGVGNSNPIVNPKLRRTYSENKSFLEESFPNMEIETNYKFRDLDGLVGIVDMVIRNPRNGKEVYVQYKGKNVLPATPVDVLLLSHIKNENIANGKNNFKYIIFCDRPEKTDSTENIAHVNDISYYKSSKDVIKNIRDHIL